MPAQFKSKHVDNARAQLKHGEGMQRGKTDKADQRRLPCMALHILMK
jgi:hypothetical protein